MLRPRKGCSWVFPPAQPHINPKSLSSPGAIAEPKPSQRRLRGLRPAVVILVDARQARRPGAIPNGRAEPELERAPPTTTENYDSRRYAGEDKDLQNRLVSRFFGVEIG